MRSAYQTWLHKSGHCLESAFLSAAILEHRGYPPLIISLDSADNIGHILFVFQRGSKWGAVGRSKEEGLHGRAPIFRSLRDLAWSYVDPYVDDTGRVVAWRAANLDESGSPWRFSNENVWKCENYILKLKHQPLRASPVRHKRALRAFEGGGHKRLESWW